MNLISFFDVVAINLISLGNMLSVRYFI